VSITVQEYLRSNVKEIINRLNTIQGRKVISLLPSHLVPESLSFCSVLERQVNCRTCTLDCNGILHWNVSEI